MGVGVVRRMLGNGKIMVAVVRTDGMKSASARYEQKRYFSCPTAAVKYADELFDSVSWQTEKHKQPVGLVHSGVRL